MEAPRCPQAPNHHIMTQMLIFKIFYLQDKVAEFAKMTQQQLLEATEKAVTLNSLDYCSFICTCMGGRVGLVVRALAIHQCGPGSISALSVIKILIIWIGFVGSPFFSERVSLGTPVFSSHQKPTFDLI